MAQFIFLVLEPINRGFHCLKLLLLDLCPRLCLIDEGLKTLCLSTFQQSPNPGPARQLFDAIGIDGSELVNALHDKDRFSNEEWAALQRQREILEKAIDDRILAAKKSKKPTQAKPSHIQGHWIFVR